jgi:membrane protein implicated in regulation of membrane protease activity
VLILQIAIGIVLGGLLLAYFGEILVLGVGAIILIAVVLLIAVVGIFLYEAITLYVVLSLLAFFVALYLLNKFFQCNWYLKKSLRKQIKNKEDLGYEPFDLKEKLKKIEDDEHQADIKSKELNEKKILMKNDYKLLIKSSSRAKAKEIARRRSLGYDK